MTPIFYHHDRCVESQRCLSILHDGDGGACAERVQDGPHLHMRPPATPSGLDVPFVQLGRNLIVARGTRAHDLLNDGADIGRKLPRIRLYGRNAAFCSLGQVGIA